MTERCVIDCVWIKGDVIAAAFTHPEPPAGALFCLYELCLNGPMASNGLRITATN